MDRLFVLQGSYVDDRYNVDGIVIKRLCDLHCRRNLDRFVIRDEYDELKKFRTVLVGDLEFTGGNKLKPIEVPEVLRKQQYLNRDYIIGGYEQAKEAKHKFIKRADKIKSWNNLLYLGSNKDITDELDENGMYVISDILDIVSEYRVFVYRDEVQACQHYLGDVTIFPDRNIILSMINDYKLDEERPEAYTLDICIDSNGKTSILEVHNFVSCGLYGFQDESILNMLDSGYKYVIAHAERTIQ